MSSQHGFKVSPQLKLLDGTHALKYTVPLLWSKSTVFLTRFR